MSLLPAFVDGKEPPLIEIFCDIRYNLILIIPMPWSSHPLFWQSKQRPKSLSGKFGRRKCLR
jgi:hypothetical protein